MLFQPIFTKLAVITVSYGGRERESQRKCVRAIENGQTKTSKRKRANIKEQNQKTRSKKSKSKSKVYVQ